MQCKLTEHSFEYAHASVDMRCSTANLQFSATATSSRLELKSLKVLNIIVISKYRISVQVLTHTKDNRLKFQSLNCAKGRLQHSEGSQH